MDNVAKISALKKSVEIAEGVSKKILELISNENNVVGVLAVMSVYKAQRDMNPTLHAAMNKLMEKAVEDSDENAMRMR